MAAVSGLLAVALVGAIVGGVMWAVAALGSDTSSDGNGAVAQRDQFLVDATQAALNLTTVTPDDTEGMLTNIQSSSTGGLAADLEDAAVREELANDVQQRGVTQIPSVVGISASELDPDAGTGKALVFITQKLSWGEGQSALRRQGISLDMTVVDGVWKVSTMAQLFEGVGSMPGNPAEPSGADGGGDGGGDGDGGGQQPGSAPEDAPPAAPNPAGS